MRAKGRRRVAVPWLYSRRMIAERWRIPPPDVETYPADEVELELRFMELEAEVSLEDRP